MVPAPSKPIELKLMYNLFNGALKNPTEREMCEFLGLWASDEGADCSIRKRVTSYILPGKRSRDGHRALDTDVVRA